MWRITYIGNPIHTGTQADCIDYLIRKHGNVPVIQLIRAGWCVERASS